MKNRIRVGREKQKGTLRLGVDVLGLPFG